jgi:hypothetical protein
MVVLRERASALLLLISAVLAPARPQALQTQSPPVPDYQVKATFLFQFAQFVDWPREAFPETQASLVIGILGQDPFGTYLDETVRNESVRDHQLSIERYHRVEDIRRCHILFVSRSEANRVEQILAGLKGHHTLTVSDVNEFAGRGGMIEFLTQENKIRLRINLGAAKAAGLTISSKLLRPANVINSAEK